MSKKRKKRKPSFRMQRDGVAFRRHDFAKLRSDAEKAVTTLQKRDPDGEKRLLANQEELTAAITGLVKTSEWSNVRLDPRVIAGYLTENQPPTDGKQEEMAEYIGACLDQIVDEKARMSLTVIALSAQARLVARNSDRLAWTNLIMLNLLTNPETKSRSIPILHHLFWLNYADYIFQRNVMGFVSRVLDPDLLQSEVFCNVLAQDWEEDEIDTGGLAESLGFGAEETVTKIAETTRLTTLAAKSLEGLIPEDEVVELALDAISSEAVELIRAAMDNKSGKEEIEAAAAGLVRQVAATAARSFQTKIYLENLEGILAALSGADVGTLPRELAQRAKSVLNLLPVRFNPLFDAILLMGVRRKATQDYHSSEAKQAEPTSPPEDAEDVKPAEPTDV